MVAFNTVRVGDVLYDGGTYKMGNTKLREVGNWPVKIVEVDTVRGRVLASWNSNTPKWFSERAVKAWRRTPAPKRNPFGLSAPSTQ
jgi:hypothetical protein